MLVVKAFVMSLLQNDCVVENVAELNADRC